MCPFDLQNHGLNESKRRSCRKPANPVLATQVQQKSARRTQAKRPPPVPFAENVAMGRHPFDAQSAPAKPQVQQEMYHAVHHSCNHQHGTGTLRGDQPAGGSQNRVQSPAGADQMRIAHGRTERAFQPLRWPETPGNAAQKQRSWAAKPVPSPRPAPRHQQPARQQGCDLCVVVIPCRLPPLAPRCPCAKAEHPVERGQDDRANCPQPRWGRPTDLPHYARMTAPKMGHGGFEITMGWRVSAHGGA